MKLYELFGFREQSYVPRPQDRWPEMVGVELELENVTNYTMPIPYWTTHDDGSLRNGIELVLEQPLAGKSLEDAIGQYYKADLRFSNSSRTSTHIHINMTDATVDQLRSMCMVMYMVEDGLFNVVGEARKWSGYSVPLSEMEPLRLRRMMSSTDPTALVNFFSPVRNQERYYGFNTCLRKHGTVEFRYFPGGPSREELESWIDFAITIKKLGQKYSPGQLVERIHNEQDVNSFLTENFNEHWAVKLAQATSASYMLGKFSEIAAFVVDAENLERMEQLVFVTKPFIQYLGNKILPPSGVEYIRSVADQLQVTTAYEWNQHLLRAMGQVKQTRPLKTKPYGDWAVNPGAVEAQQEPYPETVAVDYPVPPPPAAAANRPTLHEILRTPTRRGAGRPRVRPDPVYVGGNVNPFVVVPEDQATMAARAAVERVRERERERQLAERLRQFQNLDDNDL